MTKPENVAASVRDRLLRLARERGADYQLLLTRYANERLLYRLAQSRHARHFVLKGAALFTLWTGQAHRATRDLDLLSSRELSPESLHEIFAELLSQVADDGVVFDAESLEATLIREGQPFGGVRLVFMAGIASARLRMQVDIGMGDAITPAAAEVDFPALLDFAGPRLLAYPRETVVAEKLEAIVTRGMANTRMKDFYDLALLADLFEFDGEVLTAAIGATFERRGTRLPATVPLGLTAAFAEDPGKATQWAAFVRKSGAPPIGELIAVVEAVATFVVAPLAAAQAESRLERKWAPGTGWK